MTPIHTEHFYGEGRGPDLVALRWGFSGRVPEAAEFILPDAASPEDLRHVRFVRPQVVMRTPEEVIDYRAVGPEFSKHPPAAMFDLGQSEWLKSFSPRHLGRCTHLQLYFYDELIDIIAEGVTFSFGPYLKKDADPVGTDDDRAAPGRRLTPSDGRTKMKPVPPRIIASGPPDTEWFGGAVDRSTITLRVKAKVRDESVDKKEVAQLLGCESDQQKFKHWSLHAPESEESDLDSQVDWILSRLTSDLAVWKKIVANYRVDLFCGLHLERSNRGVTLAPGIMTALGSRGIELGFDIYAPKEPIQPSKDNDGVAPRRV